MRALIVIHPAHQPQFGDAARRVRRVDQVPGREIEIDLRRHRPATGTLAAAAEDRHDRRNIDRAVEVSTGQVHAVVCEYIGAWSATPCAAHGPHDREIEVPPPISATSTSRSPSPQ